MSSASAPKPGGKSAPLEPIDKGAIKQNTGNAVAGRPGTGPNGGKVANNMDSVHAGAIEVTAVASPFGKICWEDAMATNMLLINHHKRIVSKMLELDLVKEEIKNESWKEGVGPLHIAAGFGSPELIKMLVEGGAKVNAYASGLGSWMTPLHTAVLEEKMDAVKVLVELGANLHAKGFKDETKGTPLDFARERKVKPEIIKFLEKCTLEPSEDKTQDKKKPNESGNAKVRSGEKPQKAATADKIRSSK